MPRKSKRARCCGAGEDRERLSSLPNDILINNILSLLPMLEAQRTSILARSWRYLWRYVPCLDLDGSREAVRFRPNRISGGVSSEELEEAAASKYAEWVDQTIDAHRGTTALRRFRVLFRLGASSASNIDSWLEFSLRRGVEVLELDCCDVIAFMSYEFPDIEPSMYPNLRFLKSLTLKAVEMPHDEDCRLNGLLLACEFLERLHLHKVFHLMRLEVNGPVSMLKQIHIHRCKSLQSIAIHLPTPYLDSFIYPQDNRGIPVHIEHAPRLVDLRVRPFSKSGTVHLLFRYLSQLEALHLVYYPKDMV